MKVLLISLLSSVMIIATSACGGVSNPVVNDYRGAVPPRFVVTPQSVCRQPCGGTGGDPGPCAITSQTVAVSPPDRTRTTIGVGEQVVLTTVGHTWTVGGDGTLNSTSGSPVTLTAGAKSGSVTVDVDGDGKICTANSDTFEVVAPSSVHYEKASGIYHLVNIANIGINSNVYLEPSTVSFMNTWFEETQEKFVANGSWICQLGQNHEPSAQPSEAGSTVSTYGTNIQALDNEYTGSCSGNQIQQSSEFVSIPTNYSLSKTGPWNSISSVYQNANETSAGLMTLTKDDANATKSVTDSTSGY